LLPEKVLDDRDDLLLSVHMLVPHQPSLSSTAIEMIRSYLLVSLISHGAVATRATS
jgi:hypothetical protein